MRTVRLRPHGFVAIALTAAAVVAAAATGPAEARSKPYCSSGFLGAYRGYKPRLVASNGGIKFFRAGSRGDDDFWACSDRTKTSAAGQASDVGATRATLQRLVGQGGRCAIAVLKLTGNPSYQGSPISKTIVAEYRLYTANGLGYSISATPGTAALNVVRASIASNCYAVWAEEQPAQKSYTLNYANIGNRKVFEDPNRTAGTISVTARGDLFRWKVTAKGGGATLRYTDGGVAKTAALPAN